MGLPTSLLRVPDQDFGGADSPVKDWLGMAAESRKKAMAPPKRRSEGDSQKGCHAAQGLPTAKADNHLPELPPLLQIVERRAGPPVKGSSTRAAEETGPGGSIPQLKASMPVDGSALAVRT